MLQFVLTGIVNLLTYLSVTITTGTNTSLLSAIFLFSASIGLEALSLWHDNDRANSGIVFFAFCALTFVFSAGWLFSITGYSGFIDVSIQQCSNAPRIIVAVPKDSILPHFSPKGTDITDLINLCGLISTSVPFVLASRIQRIRSCRKKYSLKYGLYGK